MNPSLRKRIPIYVTAVVLAAAAAFVPTPYSLILPGRAVDLRTAVAVDHHASAAHFYLTDVRFVPHATTIALLGGLAPGSRVVLTKDFMPRGMSAGNYEGIEREAMSESQDIAAVVAERAAGLHVAQPRSRVLVLYFSPESRARHVLSAMDILLAVNGRPIASISDVVRALAKVKTGTLVRVAAMRHGEERIVTVPTIAYKGRPIIGVFLTTIYQRPPLPVPVAYHLPNIAGSSGGVMFALQIYRTLKGLPDSVSRVAGTGTIAFDGSVGPIEGARQKVIAAREAGATLFLVPKENYREIAGTRGITIVPVSTFRDAVRAVF